MRLTAQQSRAHLRMPEMSISPLIHLGLVLLLVSLLAMALLRKNGAPAAASGPGVVSREPPATQLAPSSPTPAPFVGRADSKPVVARRQVSVPGGGGYEMTLTHESADSPPSASAQAADLASVDQALLEALAQNWVPPPGPGSGRPSPGAEMDVVVARDGTVETYALVRASGQAQLDMSVLRTAGLVKRVSRPLPAEFSGDRHEVRIHFRAL